MVINVLVSNLTNDVASTALAPIKSLTAPHPHVPVNPLTVIIIVVAVCLMLVGVSTI